LPDEIVCATVQKAIENIPDLGFYSAFHRHLSSLQMVEKRFRQCILYLFPVWKLTLLESCAQAGVHYYDLLHGQLFFPETQRLMQHSLAQRHCLAKVATGISNGFVLDQIRIADYAIIPQTLRDHIRQHGIGVFVGHIDTMEDLIALDRDVSIYQIPQWQLELLAVCSEAGFNFNHLTLGILTQENLKMENLPACFVALESAYKYRGYRVRRVHVNFPSDYLNLIPPLIRQYRPDVSFDGVTTVTENELELIAASANSIDSCMYGYYFLFYFLNFSFKAIDFEDLDFTP
jgi:hypothetical protein